MSFGEAILICLQKSFVIHGRASRSEFWFFQLFMMLVALIGVLITNSFYKWGILIYIIVSMMLAVPQLAVATRRLHDVDKSGWYLFWSSVIWGGGFFLVNGKIKESVAAFLIIEFGNILFMTFNFLKKGTKGSNKYGDEPV